MPVSPSKIGILAGKGRSLALRFWNCVVDPATFAVLDGAPNPTANVRVLITSTNRQYAWDATGRYVWWRDDGAWTAHDYGSGVGGGNVIGRVVMKDGVETMLLVSQDSAAGTAAWATIATPPVRTNFVSPIAGSLQRIATAYDGEPLICGQISANAPRLTRWISGAWQTVAIPGTDPTDNAVYAACKTGAGTYLVCGYENSPARTWVRRSTDFVSWSGDIDVVTDATQAIGFAMIPGPGGVASRMLLRGTAADRQIRSSNDDGASWSLAFTAAPPGGDGFYDAATGLYIYSGASSDSRIWTSPDAFVWTQRTLTTTPGGAAQKLSFLR